MHGPDGGTVSTIDVDAGRPSVLYAGTHGAGVFRSGDGGRTRARSSDGLPLYRSTDGARMSRELPAFDATIADLDVDPARPDTVYLAAHQELLRSTDGGSTWNRVGRSSRPRGSRSPRRRRRCSTRRTADRSCEARTAVPVGRNRRRGPTAIRGGSAGASWTHVATLPRERVRDLGLGGGAVYAGLDHRGFYRSAGGQWSPSSRGLVGSNVRALALDPRAPAIVYAGLMNAGVARSTNGGRTWARSGLDGRIVNSLTVIAGVHVVLAGVAGGVYRSTYGGRRWRRARGIGNADERAVAYAPSRPRVVYAGSFERSSYRSTDGGASWRRMGLPFLQTVTSLAVHPRQPNTLWAGTREDGVLRSTDGGRTWSDLTGGMWTTWISSLALDPPGRTLCVATTAYGLESGGGVFAARVR